MTRSAARPSDWPIKVLAILKAGNTDAAIAQMKVAPSVKDLRQLKAALAAAKLPRMAAVEQVLDEQIALLEAPRLHRSP
ncbi:MAG: hypothetical protein EOO28_31390 [Comamonadaceae bacterium]|nr:MAG: hypothetical protein EOO28_31390 [Comamonadaceae bacterium]